MEYCVGGSVIDLIRFIGEPFTYEYLIALALQGTLKGIEYLHKNKKIHRDINAGNILLDVCSEVPDYWPEEKTEYQRTAEWPFYCEENQEEKIIQEVIQHKISLVERKVHIT